jgi:chemotaxis methyl-accepting protein methylase
MDNRDFTLLLDRFALSSEGYRKVRKGVQKRIVRHMQALRCPTMKAYLERLDTDGDSEHEARRLMDVSISRFFRDEPLWRTLEAKILPSLIEEHPRGLRAWSAGCALGQEAYSLRILQDLFAEKTPAMPPLELWATDVNPAYLERARDGVYPAAALSRIPPDTRARFFRPAGKRSFRVVEELREDIRWQIHDLTADAAPARDFHIVFLRNNLLTYYRREIVEAALPAIADSIERGGYLAIGQKERLPDFLKGFDPHPDLSCLFRKRGSGVSS